MKRRASSAVAVLTVSALAILLIPGAASEATAADVSFGFFYSNLQPYGTWAVSANYGQVWQPYGYAPGWNPYYDGHWVYTDLGWTWVSDYPWGAVPYHYGTWAVDPVLGWIWVPGYVWAPSWVVFCSGPDYIGWAPVPPRFVVGASVGFRDVGYDRFVLVPARSFLAPRVRAHVVPHGVARNALGRTRIINNIDIHNNVVVNRGLDPRGIERVSGARVQRVPIAKVARVTPGREFNVNDVRANRNAGWGSPRATSPEPARTPPSAKPSVGKDFARERGPARQQGPARMSEPARPSGPMKMSEPGSAKHRGQAPQSARPSGPPSVRPSSRPPAAQSSIPPPTPNAGREPGRGPSKPPASGKQPASQRQGKPEKPPAKSGGDHGHH